VGQQRKVTMRNLNTIFFSSNFFDLNIDKNESDIINELFLHCKSKFNLEFNMEIINEQSDGDGISVIVVSDYDTEIVFEDTADILRFPDKKRISASPGDIISFHSSNNFISNQTIKLYNFNYKIDEKVFGEGSKLFEVTATLKDEYKIRVKSDSYEDAIKQAYSINLTEWKHVELNTNLPSIQINRYTKWGMLDAFELPKNPG
jgi:hypothetical protein